MNEQSRKVLEEIQKAKSMLKAGVNLNNSTNYSNSVNQITGNSQPQPPLSSQSTNFMTEILSPVQRTALQSLQSANSMSFGFFIPTDSHFGNGILPVLPRIENQPAKNSDSTKSITLGKFNEI